MLLVWQNCNRKYAGKSFYTAVEINFMEPFSCGMKIIICEYLKFQLNSQLKYYFELSDGIL